MTELNRKKKVLFIDRDGTLVVEPPVDYQLDSLEKLEFVPKVFRNMHIIADSLDYELAMVTNQDGLGTPSFPVETFLPPHQKMLRAFESEGVVFDEIFIDSTFPEENAPTRKPGTAMLSKYFSGDYDLSASYVIGDRITDVMLAHNLGAKAIFFTDEVTGRSRVAENNLEQDCVLITDDWDKISQFLCSEERSASIVRNTQETSISISLNLDGTGKCNISTGIGFFDHMLEQIGKHASIDLDVQVKGDTYVDEHHTIEDTGIVLGEALYKALGSKRGIERYGFVLPMDDCLCTVALDFGGRSWIQWDAQFNREKIGEMPTEMFFHFFKSVSDSAKMNLAIIATGDNEHHKIEGIFKAFARAVKEAIKRDVFSYSLPSTKGVL